MDANQFRNAIDFDRSLAVGQVVEARWTANHCEHAVRAEIVKLNEKSLRVKLLEEVSTVGGFKYPVGHSISLPRLLAFDKVSIKNCAAALPKFKRGEIIEGRGKVVEVWFTTYSHEYRCEGEKVPSSAI
jgi:hypothetical protein